jgi:membrane peptidoglycan carboxypeptidase
VNPLELTSAYSTFANDGTRATPYAIISVEDHNGKVLYRAKPQREDVLDPQVAHMMTSALVDVVNGGTGSRIRTVGFNYPAAGKTGTTQNYADAWFVGYTPQFTAGVWVGFDDKRITFTSADGQGGHAAAPIWGKFMKYSYEALRPKMMYFVTSYTPSSRSGDAGDSLRRADTNYVPPIPPVKNEPPMPTAKKASMLPSEMIEQRPLVHSRR